MAKWGPWFIHYDLEQAGWLVCSEKKDHAANEWKVIWAGPFNSEEEALKRSQKFTPDMLAARQSS